MQGFKAEAFRERNLIPRISELLLAFRKYKLNSNSTIKTTYLPLRKTKGLVFHYVLEV